MSTIPILTVIDCASIVAKYTGSTFDAPVMITDSAPYIFMVTSSGFVVNAPSGEGEGSSNLQITVKPGDTVQWTMTSIDVGAQYNAILQQINIDTPPVPPFKAPTYAPAVSYNQFVGPPQTNKAEPLTPLAYSDYIFTTQIDKSAKAGTYPYQIVFYITDNAGKVLGYYYWEPQSIAVLS